MRALPATRAGSDLQRAVSGVVVAAGCLGASLVAGLAVGDPLLGVLVLPLLGLLIFVGIAAVSRGAFVAVILLAVMNGIPFLDLSALAVPGVFRPSDVMFVLLIAFLVFWLLVDRGDAVDPHWRRFTRIWAFLFVAWWAFTLARSVLYFDIPFLDAALYGRDFLYFGLVLPLLPAGLRTRRELVSFGWVVGVATLLFSLAQTLSSLAPSLAAAVGADLIIHPLLSNEYEGVTRIYASMGDVVTAGAIVAAGFALLAGAGRRRTLAALLFAVFTVGGLVQLSRATYFVMAVGILVVLFGAIWWSERRMRIVRLLPAAAAILLLVPILSTIRPTEYSSASAAEIFQARATSAFDEIGTGGGTVGYRQSLQDRMLDVLGDRWAVGLGFWHPSARPVSTLPSGSIRNTDVGVLNGIMTMGVVGTVLLYVPFVGIVVLLARSRFGVDGSDGVRLGIVGWVAGVVAGSLTLVTLFSDYGLLLAAIALTLAASPALFAPAPGEPEPGA